MIIEIDEKTLAAIEKNADSEDVSISDALCDHIPALCANVRELKKENARLRSGIASLKADVGARATPDADDASDTIAAIDALLADGVHPAEDANLPVNSIGTCARCGYHGPGPRHPCSSPPAKTMP